MDIVTTVRLATILDCEGWITIQKCKGSRGIALALVLGVGNTNPILPEWLKETFGGSVYKTCRESNNHKDYWTWRIHSNRASELLKAALPYMLLKMEQAKLAVTFQETMHSRSYINEPCTPEYVERMWDLKHQLTKLNRKGKLPPAETKRDDTKPALVAGSEAIVRPVEKPTELTRNELVQAYA